MDTKQILEKLQKELPGAPTREFLTAKGKIKVDKGVKVKSEKIEANAAGRPDPSTIDIDAPAPQGGPPA